MSPQGQVPPLALPHGWPASGASIPCSRIRTGPTSMVSPSTIVAGSRMRASLLRRDDEAAVNTMAIASAKRAVIYDDRGNASLGERKEFWCTDCKRGLVGLKVLREATPKHQGRDADFNSIVDRPRCDALVCCSAGRRVDYPGRAQARWRDGYCLRNCCFPGVQA